MKYKFERHEPCFDRVLFVLTLDKKKICDVTRQLGTFLIEFEQDPDGEWNRLGLAPLREALRTNRWNDFVKIS